ncbi:MAG: hypothetical protein P8Z69_00615 [Acidihalobacter sp.]|jgi:hypothetical protein
MNKGKFAIAFFSGILGLGIACTAFAQSSNSNPIILQPGSGNQKIQRGDDGMQGNSGMEGGGEHEGMGNSHSGGMNGSGEDSSEGRGEIGG